MHIHARRKLQRTADPVEKGREGPDADHAGNVGRLAAALGADPYHTHYNILVGAAYIREFHNRYGVPGFLAAYNTGPVRYERPLATGRPLPEETLRTPSRSLRLPRESRPPARP